MAEAEKDGGGLPPSLPDSRVDWSVFLDWIGSLPLFAKLEPFCVGGGK